MCLRAYVMRVCMRVHPLVLVRIMKAYFNTMQATSSLELILLLYKAPHTSLLCSHSHFFTKLSYSILVCCSHSHVVGRMGHQTEDIIRHCHPNRNCHYSIEGVIHIIRREYSSVLHLISGPTVVVG